MMLAAVPPSWMIPWTRASGWSCCRQSPTELKIGQEIVIPPVDPALPVGVDEMVLHLTAPVADLVDPPKPVRRILKTWTADQLRTFLAGVAEDRLAALYQLAAASGGHLSIGDE